MTLNWLQAFWDSFESGKLFAKRQSVWDVTWEVIFGGFDRDAVSLLMRVLSIAVVNFTAGMVISVFAFLFRLPGIIVSFAPNPMSGFAFFAVSTIGALSVVASFIALLIGASAGVVYAVYTLPQLQGANARQRPQRVSYQQYSQHNARQHYD